MQVRQEVFDTYWKVAAERQEIFFRKLRNSHPPYSDDPIFQHFKFCNTYRASDRVSQFLIKDILYSGHFSDEETLFRTLLFRLLNKIETWKSLKENFGEISFKTYDFNDYADFLTELKATAPIYGNAFILCANKAYGYDQKHMNHLALLDSLFNDGTAEKLLRSRTLEELFTTLRSLPLIGDFMAYQIAIDLNYSELFDFDENEFTMPGPGAKRGINKCFVNLGGKSEKYIIHWMVENQHREFERLGIKFKDLFGRPLKAIDCQGLFCETDKYCRVKFPEIKTNRTRIKEVYKAKSEPISYFYPPKWNIDPNTIL